MANFKLRLITPNNDEPFSLASGNLEETFLASLITNYQDQRSQYINNTSFNSKEAAQNALVHGTSYTYDEKLSLHKNGQKELTFSMDEKVFMDNEWVENPFAHILRNGVQIELTDKYNNCMLFTVKKIAYNFHNTNIVYNVTCQDSFTYQLTHQNEGYNLTNDETSRDFIGALDIDTWAEKVVHECYVTYKYVPLDTGIYQDIFGRLSIFEVPGDDIVTTPNLSSINDSNTTAKIIKPIYNKSTYPEFYETFPFAVSGSNAAAALIAMAEQLGLQLNIVEGYDSNYSEGQPITYLRYFYFGPTKNPDVSGLIYSPLRDIQNFNLSLAGDSLTTVLNVKSTTWDDEEIGLLPRMPAFFSSFILTDTSWENSTYYEGYFLDLVRGKLLTDQSILDMTGIISVTAGSDTYLAIPINKKKLGQWPVLYNQISFSSVDNKSLTTFQYLRLGSESGIYTPRTNEMGILVSNKFITVNDLFESSTIQGTPIFGAPAYVISDNMKDLFGDDFVQQSFTQTDEIHVPNVTYQIIVTRQNTNIVVCAFKNTADVGVYEPADISAISSDFLNLCVIDTSNLNVDDPVFYPECTNIALEQIQNFNADKQKFYVYIKNASGALTLQDLFMRVTRQYSQEELDFAQAAENCPWLENKLIDFSYFVKLGIISKKEYSNLIDIITNDLRIINGQLMCYATSYYEALHKQTKMLAELQATTDKLGAEFYADVVEPYATTGMMKSSIGNFIAAYNNIFVPTLVASTPKPLMKLNNIVSDYFNKYLSANQRFLKNIYNFRQYFNSPNIYSINGEEQLQEVAYNISLDDTSAVLNPNLLVGFTDSINWTQLTANSEIIVKDDENNPLYSMVPLYVWDNSKYIQKTLPNPQTYKDFYIAQVTEDSLTAITENHQYNTRNSYYLTRTNFTNFFPNEDITKQDIFTINNVDYVKLKYSHIVQLYLNEHSGQYYLRDTNTKVPLEWVRCNRETIRQAFNICCWPGIEQLQQFIPNFMISDAFDDNNNAFMNTAWPMYKALMPIGKVYIKDYNLKYITTTNNNIPEYQWQVLDEQNNPYVYTGDSDYPWRDSQGNSLTTAQLYQTYFEVASLNYQGSLDNILHNDNDTGASIGNIISISSYLNSYKQQSNYYTKKVTFNWGAALARAGLKMLYLTPFSLLVPNPWNIEWTTAGRTDYAWGVDSQLDLNRGNNNTDNNLGDATKHTRGDSYFVNYAKTADAETMSTELHASANYLRAQLGETNNYHYLDYYNFIVLDYSTEATQHTNANDLTDNYDLTDSEQDYGKFWVNNRYASICTASTPINPHDEYIWVKCGKGNKDYIHLSTSRFSAIKFYGLTEGKEKIQLSAYFKDSEYNAIEPIYIGGSKGLVTKAGGFIDNNNKIRFDETPTTDTQYFYILHLEPYEKAIINNSNTIYTNPNNYYINRADINKIDKIYNLTTERELRIQDIVLSNSNILYIPATDEKLVLVKDIEDNQGTIWRNRDSYHWYETSELSSRTYTLSQIFDNDLPYYYIGTSTLKTTEVVRTSAQILKNFAISIHSYTIQEDKSVITDNLIHKYDIQWNFTDTAQPITIEIPNHDNVVKPVRIKLTRTVLQTTDIGQMTNGEFWYYLHNRMDMQDLLEKVIVIETQLTSYWEQAYTASQYCEWFLPPSWILEPDNKTNFFAKSLYYLDPDNKLILSKEIIPTVEIYSYERETVLPAYIFHYGNVLEKGTYKLDEIDALRNNTAVRDAINHIFPDMNYLLPLVVQEYGRTTYYYRIGGGLLWKDVIHYLNPNEKTYDHFDGLYPMQLDILLHQYIDATPFCYERTLEQKLTLWRNIYARFPGIFLENTYENKDARSSAQLLKMAQLAFKDYTEPEKQYNITLIDAQVLEGYTGQELHIGDGILLDTSQYYPDVDEIYRALNQYLFISDISYSLRQDTDISLTINTIKYQDKLLQSIVKLIR